MKKLSEMIKEKGIVMICLVAGVLLLLMPQMFVNKEKSDISSEMTASDELAQYASLLETRLRKAVVQMIGSESVKVIVTLDSTFENVYVSDASIDEAVTADKTDVKSERQLVLTGASGQQMPVVVKRIPPKVKGVVIVCPGGNDKNIRSSIADMAATALNISETKIYVTGGY